MKDQGESFVCGESSRMYRVRVLAVFAVLGGGGGGVVFSRQAMRRIDRTGDEEKK
jgi:hypothetical protein